MENNETWREMKETKQESEEIEYNEDKTMKKVWILRKCGRKLSKRRENRKKGVKEGQIRRIT